MTRPTLAVLAAFVLGCSARSPVLYPDAHARQVGEAQQQRDIAECRALAERVVGGSTDARAGAQSTVAGSAIGGASGAAGGAIYGDAGRGAAAGAAGGAVAGFLGWLFHPRQPDPAYVGVVNQCLADRGYRVVGWK
jgi:outer membrane lipoprotein SlyB